MQALVQGPASDSLDAQQSLTTWLEQQQLSIAGGWQLLVEAFKQGDHPLFIATPMETSDGMVYQLALRDGSVVSLPSLNGTSDAFASGTESTGTLNTPHASEAVDDTITLVAQLNRPQAAGRPIAGNENSQTPDASYNKANTKPEQPSEDKSEGPAGESDTSTGEKPTE